MTTTDATRRVMFGVAVGVALMVGMASLAIGAEGVPLGEVVQAFLDPQPDNSAHVIVREIRLPRTVVGLLVGAGLGAAGTLVQTLTRNPLAEPGILGVTAGSAFAIVVGTALGVAGSQFAQLSLAVVGAVVASAGVYLVGRGSPLRLVLAGVALSAVLAGITLGLRLIDPDVFDRYRFWSVGSLAGRDQLDLLLPGIVAGTGLLGAVLVTRPLNALALGDDVAHTLGSQVQRVRFLVLALVTVLAGAATAIAGPIAFVGLMVPHLARRFAAGSIPWLMAFTMVLGPILLVAADIVSRVLLTTGEVPVAIVTAFVGGPVLIWVVRRYGAATL